MNTKLLTPAYEKDRVPGRQTKEKKVRMKEEIENSDKFPTAETHMAIHSDSMTYHYPKVFTVSTSSAARFFRCYVAVGCRALVVTVRCRARRHGVTRCG